MPVLPPYDLVNQAALAVVDVARASYPGDAARQALETARDQGVDPAGSAAAMMRDCRTAAYDYRTVPGLLAHRGNPKGFEYV